MNRRKFFSNLVASVGTLVAAYATPISRVRRLDDSLEWATFLMDGKKYEALCWKGVAPYLTIRHLPKSPWMEMVRRGAFPANMGDVKRSI